MMVEFFVLTSGHEIVNGGVFVSQPEVICLQGRLFLSLGAVGAEVGALNGY